MELEHVEQSLVRYTAEGPIVDFPGRCKSNVWNFFGFYLDAEQEIDRTYAICRVCTNRIKYTGNTTNLASHLSKHHDLITMNDNIMYTGAGRSTVESATLVDCQYTASNNDMALIGTALNGDDAAALSQYTSMQMIPTAAHSGALMYMEEMPVRGQYSVQPTQLTVNSSKPRAPRNVAPQHGAEMLGPRYLGIVSAIADFLMIDLKPMGTIDGTGFQRLMHALDSRFTITPKLKERITNRICTEMYGSCKGHVIDTLRKAISRRKTLIIDRWHSTPNHSSFVTFSAQFFSDALSRLNYVLETRPILEDEETIVNSIAEAIMEVCHVWSVADPIIVGTSEVEREATNKIRLPFVPCLGWALREMVATCFERDEIASVIAHVRLLVRHFTEDKVAAAALKEHQCRLNSSQEIITIDIRSSWYSTCTMLWDVLRNRAAMEAALVALSSSPTAANHAIWLTDQELKILETLVSVLQPLRTTAMALLEQDTPLASIILPVVSQLKMRLGISTTPDDMAHTIKQAMCDRLTVLYPAQCDLYDTLLVCATLDPRFKDLLFLDEAHRTHAYKLVSDRAAHFNKVSLGQLIIKEEPRDEEDCEIIEATSADSDESFNGPPSKRLALQAQSASTIHYQKPSSCSAMSALFEGMLSDEVASTSDVNILVSSELQRYLADDRIALSDDPLSWWAKRTYIYPHLYAVAVDILCVPATASPASHLFTKEATIQLTKRCTIEEQYLDKMLFVHHNNSARACLSAPTIMATPMK